MDVQVFKWILIIFPLILLYYFLGTNGILIYIGLVFLWFITSPLFNAITDPNTSSSQKMIAAIILILLVVILFYLNQFVNWNEIFN